jgi:iron complex transport system ATP-binding protein
LHFAGEQLMTELHAKNISVMADGQTLVENASLQLRQGELVVMLGPNGAGKTMLLRAILGMNAKSTGSSTLGEAEIGKLSPMQRAKQISYLPQRRPLAWPNTVRDVVALGRFSHGVSLGRLSKQDAAAVDQAIHSCDLDTLAERNTDTLSGGELARVHVARAMAAQAPLLIADEPIAALDPRHQLSILELIRRYVDNGGGALLVLHEITLAARFADRLVWMADGQIVADGSPMETCTEQQLRDVFAVSATVRSDTDGFDIRINGSL